MPLAHGRGTVIHALDNLAPLIPVILALGRLVLARPDDARAGIAYLSVGSAITVLIDGYHTGNPGPVHGLPAGLTWWLGVWFLVLGWAHVLGSTHEPGEPLNGVLSLLAAPGALVVADLFLHRELPVHTYVAGVSAALAAGAVLLAAWIVLHGSPRTPNYKTYKLAWRDEPK